MGGWREDVVDIADGPVDKLKKASRSLFASIGGFSTLVNDTGRLIGLGGGASGGGNFLGDGDDWIIFDSALSSRSPASWSSLALGTKSDKNERSSEDNAREWR